MDYFGLQDDIDALERVLPALQGSARLDAMATLAWYLRQRDTPRALALVDEAEAATGQPGDEQAEARSARLVLTRGEITDLMGQIATAVALCADALQRFRALGDSIGEGDAHHLDGRLWMERGGLKSLVQAFQAAVDAYRRGGDAVRAAHAELLMMEHMTLTPEEESRLWPPRLQAAEALQHPGVDTAVHFEQGVLHDGRSETGHAIAHFRLCHEACLKSGRLRMAIVAGINLSDIYFELGSLEEAMKWGEQTVALARRCNWPVPMAFAFTQVSSLWRRMGQRDKAAALVPETVGMLALAPRSRTAAAVMCEMGILDDDFERALDWLQRAREVAREQAYQHVALTVERQRAITLSQLGRVDDAIAVLHALDAELQSPAQRMDALQVRAGIAARHGMPPPGGSAASTGELHWLHEALALAQRSELPAPHELLSQLSLAHEAAGEVSEALAFERKSAAARERGRAAAAVHLATSMQVRLDTERARAAAAEHEARAAAEAARADAEAAANRAKSRFLANMSHELRSPLNAMLGFARLLARDRELSERARHDASTILSSGEHLYTLINQVLDLSKIEAGRVSVQAAALDVYALLDDLEELFSLGARSKGLVLKVQAAADVPQHAELDGVKLRQVLVNLLSNAIKFTAHGQVELQVRAAGQRLGFCVHDTGVGIEAHELQQLGQAFVQAHAGRQAAEGTGLGLAISRTFVSLMGGELELESRRGEGTSVRFDIPVRVVDTPVQAAPPPARHVTGLAPGSGRPRILAVDDWPQARQLLVRLLEPMGFEVTEAANGEEAIEIWQQWSPHLILMDMRMPVMDGREATRRIKAAPGGRETVIVALTASSFEEQREEILAAGCDDFLRKPFQEEALLEMLARHLKLQYAYEDAAAPAAPSPADPARVAALPSALRERLRAALQALDVQAIEAAIDAVRSQDETAADALAPLARQFQYERMRLLLE